MDGLIHAAALPLADAVEDFVVGDEEAVRAAPLNERRLVLGDGPAGDEEAAEGIDPLIAAGPFFFPLPVQRLHVVGREQFALDQQGAVIRGGRNGSGHRESCALSGGVSGEKCQYTTAAGTGVADRRGRAIKSGGALHSARDG